MQINMWHIHTLCGNRGSDTIHALSSPVCFCGCVDKMCSISTLTGHFDQSVQLQGAVYELRLSCCLRFKLDLA